MTVEEFEKATEQELRRRANGLFEQAAKVQVHAEARTALLTEAHFYLDEIERRDDNFRSRRDLVLELVVIVLILGEICFSYFAYRAGKEEFAVLSNLEASSRATASTLTALQQTTEAMNKTTQEQAALSFEVALKVEVNLPDLELNITNEGRTPVTLWGMRTSDESPVMQTRPSILAPGVPHSSSAERIILLAGNQMNKQHAALVPLTLFVKNEKSEEFVVRYVLVNRTTYGPLSLRTQTLSVSRMIWSKEARE